MNIPPKRIQRGGLWALPIWVHILPLAECAKQDQNILLLVYLGVRGHATVECLCLQAEAARKVEVEARSVRYFATQRHRAAFVRAGGLGMG